MKCQKCGSELRKGLSFCPKCGEVITTDSNANDSMNVSNNVQKKKTPAWLIVLAVLFFPISLTYIIVKTKKLKMPVKIILIVVLWIFVIVVGNSENENSLERSNTEITEEMDALEGENDSRETDDAKTEETEEVAIKYHGDEGINQLLVNYNEIAEIVIAPDMVQKSAYDFNANVSVNGVWVQIYNNSNGLFVDYSDEAKSDDNIYPLFRDFAKAMNSSLTNDMIKSAWAELQTGEYSNYYGEKYDLGGIQVTYLTQTLNNGTVRYTIKTELKK